jgi:hypothetical protein
MDPVQSVVDPASASATVNPFRSRGVVLGPKSGPIRLRVDRAEIAEMRAAAEVIGEIGNVLAGVPGGILAALGQAMVEWRHYPPGDVYDPRSHAQFFYHVHPPQRREPREHGHFHTFMRAEGMPAAARPFVLPETAIADAAPSPPQAAPCKRGGREEVSHIIAIALSPEGQPIRLFTTNRWVTGETWYRADDVIQMLDRFTLGGGDGPRLVNRWLSATMRLFRPQIACLLHLRDEAIMGWRRRRRSNVLEDTRIEVTSGFDIDLAGQLAFLDRLEAEPRAAAPGRPAWSLRLAEGWGDGQAG